MLMLEMRLSRRIGSGSLSFRLISLPTSCVVHVKLTAVFPSSKAFAVWAKPSNLDPPSTLYQTWFRVLGFRGLGFRVFRVFKVFRV